MAGNTAVDTATQAKTTNRTRPRRFNAEETAHGARYFLATTEASGASPTLDREVESEGEALVEALRLGVTYYALHEFRVIPDFSGRVPQLKKEPVRGK